MSRRSLLLRHMFKYGRHARHRSETSIPLLNAPEAPEPPAQVDKTLPPIPPPPKTPDKHNTVIVLPEIKEESDSEIGTPTASPSRSDFTSSDTASVVTVIRTQPKLVDASTITARDIIYASIDEAAEATHAHLRTLKTTLALLKALEGFSPTIEVLLEEFRVKKRECEGKVDELKGFEEGVDRLDFVDEVYTQKA
ncbi:hypothetical protein GMOD_00006617 [Pyrenophora seminiperda CCB06]|uniref:Uncharacterized protein n=1 Tax=Pyrenophora seminiperda CCB06 TaxID=1302712 RepID=A0A3M7MAI9_9PLEO|nr:hypothetical protein GMOD_00006617 [Pyrenophora seminiperda CCB06]